VGRNYDACELHGDIGFDSRPPPGVQTAPLRQAARSRKMAKPRTDCAIYA
jgi:hypothetical protein